MSRQHLYRLLFIMMNHDSPAFQRVKEYWNVSEEIFSVQCCVCFFFQLLFEQMDQISVKLKFTLTLCNTIKMFYFLNVLFFYSEKIWLPSHFCPMIFHSVALKMDQRPELWSRILGQQGHLCCIQFSISDFQSKWVPVRSSGTNGRPQQMDAATAADFTD